jgi:hypothetical protein
MEETKDTDDARGAKLAELRAALDEGDASPISDGYSLDKVLAKIDATPSEPKRSRREEELEKTGPITCEEAREIAKRYNASHFRHRDIEQARYTIPVDFRRDDDVRLSAFISQVEKSQGEAKREAQAHRTTEANAVIRFLRQRAGMARALARFDDTREYMATALEGAADEIANEEHLKERDDD